MSGLRVLAERCRTATGPSFVLEQEIAAALGWPLAPPVTASLDAALKLVPEGWFWKCGFGTASPGWAHVYATHPDHCERDDAFTGYAATPILALCSASLNALARGDCK